MISSKFYCAIIEPLKLFLFFRKIIKVCKRHFACNGTVVEHPEYGEVIQFQGFFDNLFSSTLKHFLGDQRDHISRFLREVKLARPEQIKIHGFWVLLMCYPLPVSFEVNF